MSQMSAERPIIQLDKSVFDKALSLISWIGSLLSLIWIVKNYPHWPETVPVHFNAAGQADGYGHKATLLMLPIIMFGLTTLLQWISNKPHLYNYPTEITPENALKEYTLAAKLILVLNAVLVSCLTAVIVITHGPEGVDPNGPGMWFLPVLLIGVFGTIIGYFIARGRSSTTS